MLSLITSCVKFSIKLKLTSIKVLKIILSFFRVPKVFEILGNIVAQFFPRNEVPPTPKFDCWSRYAQWYTPAAKLFQNV